MGPVHAPRLARTFKRIVIVGGGTAGWMTAVGLATALPACKVELESEEIGIVGVGEATFPMLREFHKSTGIDEAEFLRATNGTFKLGIEFRDWRAKGQRFFHTFGNFDDLAGPACLWGRYRRVNDPALGPLSEQCLPSVMTSQGRFAPPPREHPNLYSYAYHFDANLYARFLRGIALSRGARRASASSSSKMAAWWPATCLSTAPALFRCCWAAPELPVRADPVLAEVPLAETLQALHQRRDHYAAVVATMPTHDAFLRHIMRND